ncbi:hypothetical protein, partial [Klebsiella pneumoniae]|uniref:hypothetical protein n=1 Tax=Klebsiella pneumoniae TaxID=573 RepID=UPI002730E892
MSLRQGALVGPLEWPRRRKPNASRGRAAGHRRGSILQVVDHPGAAQAGGAERHQRLTGDR